MMAKLSICFGVRCSSLHGVQDAAATTQTNFQRCLMVSFVVMCSVYSAQVFIRVSFFHVALLHGQE